MTSFKLETNLSYVVSRCDILALIIDPNGVIAL